MKLFFTVFIGIMKYVAEYAAHQHNVTVTMHDTCIHYKHSMKSKTYVCVYYNSIYIATVQFDLMVKYTRHNFCKALIFH